MKVIVKIDKKDIAERLKAKGFDYVTERVNSDTVLYAFAYSEDIMRELCENFDSNDYHFSNRLCF